ncbi:hypothetical protein IM543_17455 [Massilia sp. UMI-21]|nr:hypothetical protein IM543_17455 [Massilia sp. UMI-21]
MQHITAGRTCTGIGILLLTAAVSVHGMGDSAAAPAQAGYAGGGHASRDVYGIVNMVPFRTSRASFNARGQAAFEYLPFDFRLRVGFFDGRRVVDPLPPADTLSVLGDLNDRGEVALLARYLDPAHPLSDGFRPVRWSAARGAVILPVPYLADADLYLGAINDRGEIVGSSSTAAGGGSYRAVRWTAANRVMPLPAPAGFGDVAAVDINDSNVAIGGSTTAAGAAHALRWDPAGRPVDLGTFGAGGAAPRYINKRGDIAGMLDPGTDNFQSFLWSPGRGLLRVGLHTVLARLNEAGEQVGRIQRAGNENHAYYFSRARGLVDLHPRALFASEANDINQGGIVVGLGRRSEGDPGLAYRWSRPGGAVDLNTRLLDPPSGLEVNEALAVAPNGDILAHSSAGLVLLRARGGGSDAPVLGPIQLPQPELNRPVTLTLSFRDRNPGDTHSATIDWGDGNGPQPAAVREYRGQGEVRATRTFTVEGDYNMVVRVTDSTGLGKMQVTSMLIRELGGPPLPGESARSGSAPRSIGGATAPPPAPAAPPAIFQATQARAPGMLRQGPPEPSR